MNYTPNDIYKSTYDMRIVVGNHFEEINNKVTIHSYMHILVCVFGDTSEITYDPHTLLL